MRKAMVGAGSWRSSSKALRASLFAVLLTTGVALAAKEYGSWSSPLNAEKEMDSSEMLNTAANDGCPILSPYDNSLYMASNRPGSTPNAAGTGNSLDIWIAPWTGNGWGTPVNAGPTINTAADEFCPTPTRGNRFFFVRRSSPTNTDIYVSKHLPKGFQTPEALPTGDNAINSPFEEWSPSYFEADGHDYLYFSSTRVGGGRQQIFYSVDFGPASLAPGLDSSASDARPNVRHDGLEIVWDSTRTGAIGGTNPDIWTATRSSVDDRWGNLVHLENGINTAAGETRASLSWEGSRLMFGSTRPSNNGVVAEGSADVYTATREKGPGQP